MASSGNHNTALQDVLKRASIKILEEPDDDHLLLELNGMPKQVVNALRRTVKSDVRTMAFHYVFIKRNNGVKQNEQLALELGKIDIRVDPSRFSDLPQSSALRYLDMDVRPKTLPILDESLEDCVLRFRLNIDCTFDGTRILHEHVTAADLVWCPFGQQVERLGQVSLVNPRFLITRLRPGQSLELEVWAILGTGAQHDKYAALCECTFWLQTAISVPRPELLDVENLADHLVNVCPKRVFSRHPISRLVQVSNANACDLCNECVNDVRVSKFVNLKPHTDRYLFRMEGKGRVPVKQVLLEALRVLQTQNRNNIQCLLSGEQENNENGGVMSYQSSSMTDSTETVGT